ncbi:MAG: hypothetical protein JO040_04685 [Gemmatimonadetes bacterium]|nr:hypothetical protein [Gemmatimonadota bacterium]
MTGLALCGLAFIATYVAGRRSLLHGIMAVLAVGYAFGIVRGNVPSTTSYFLFDASVLALYLTQLVRPVPLEERLRTRQLAHWVGLLALWPMALLLVPAQDPMVRLVGLRAHIIFLPFLLFGARMGEEEMDRLALWIAALNLVAFGFAMGEFLFGIEHFFPQNPVTEIIYRTKDVKATGDIIGSAFRIPSVFPTASSYGATMAVSVPFLLGAWVQKARSAARYWLLTTGLGASVLGVFLAASRTHVLILLVPLAVSLLSGRMGVIGRAVWIMMLGGLGWVVASDERLFLRLVALGPQAIASRFHVSVNQSFVDYALKYPLGNGLGGGGTSMPYFLLHLIRDPIGVENQYATFMLEMGLPGLLLWVGFIVWALTRRAGPSSDRWHLGRRLAWWVCVGYYLNGLIGIGFLTSVPFTILLLLSTGWIATRPAPAAHAPAAPALPHGEGLPARAYA